MLHTFSLNITFNYWLFNKIKKEEEREETSKYLNLFIVSEKGALGQ